MIADRRTARMKIHLLFLIDDFIVNEVLSGVT